MLYCVLVLDRPVDGLDDVGRVAPPSASSTFRLTMCAPGATPRVSSFALRPGRRRDARRRASRARARPGPMPRSSVKSTLADDAAAQLRHVRHAGVDHRDADAAPVSPPRQAAASPPAPGRRRSPAFVTAICAATAMVARQRVDLRIARATAWSWCAGTSSTAPLFSRFAIRSPCRAASRSTRACEPVKITVDVLEVAARAACARSSERRARVLRSCADCAPGAKAARSAAAAGAHEAQP